MAAELKTLGRVFMEPCGEHNISASYKKLSIVTVTSPDKTMAYIAKDDIEPQTAITDPKWMNLFTVKNGDPGSKGDPGADGIDGKSAYQYAVDGGYTGTESEFIADILKPLNSVTLDDVKALGYIKAMILPVVPPSPKPDTIYFIKSPT